MIRVNSRNAASSSGVMAFLRNQYACSASILSSSSRRVRVRASASVSLLNLLIGQASSCSAAVLALWAARRAPPSHEAT